MFRFSIPDVLASMKRPVEAAAVTMIGASIAYWFAPLPLYADDRWIQIAMLRYELLGAIFGEAIYLASRARRIKTQIVQRIRPGIR
jgi:hypothetical protein